MTSIMRGTDIPFFIRNLPEGAEIKRLDFAQCGIILITKTTEDFDFDGTTATAWLTQEDTLKLKEKYMIDIQLSLHINGKAKRTLIKRISSDKILYEGVI